VFLSPHIGPTEFAFLVGIAGLVALASAALAVLTLRGQTSSDRQLRKADAAAVDGRDCSTAQVRYGLLASPSGLHSASCSSLTLLSQCRSILGSLPHTPLHGFWWVHICFAAEQYVAAPSASGVTRMGTWSQLRTALWRKCSFYRSMPEPIRRCL
jgi:hypothetical protein